MLLTSEHSATITRSTRKRKGSMNRAIDGVAAALLRLRSLSFGLQRVFQRNDSSDQ